MVKDARLYAKFTVDFDQNPKIKPLSADAFRCLIEAILWSRRHLTDGFLSRRFALASWSFDVLQELSTNDPKKPSLIECEEGWYIHDFAQHQTTSAELEERREAKKRAGQKGGLASGRSRREAKTKQVLKQTRSKTKPETETETSNETTNVVSLATPHQHSTRLPPNWQPPPEVIAQMRADHPHINLKNEHAKFLDYWHAKTGQNATKKDWPATWRNWIRRAAEQQTPLAGADAKCLAWQAMKETRA